jgi:hypothetical protein
VGDGGWRRRTRKRRGRRRNAGSLAIRGSCALRASSGFTTPRRSPVRSLVRESIFPTSRTRAKVFAQKAASAWGARGQTVLRMAMLIKLIIFIYLAPCACDYSEPSSLSLSLSPPLSLRRTLPTPPSSRGSQRARERGAYCPSGRYHLGWMAYVIIRLLSGLKPARLTPRLSTASVGQVRLGSLSAPHPRLPSPTPTTPHPPRWRETSAPASRAKLRLFREFSESLVTSINSFLRLERCYARPATTAGAPPPRPSRQ